MSRFQNPPQTTRNETNFSAGDRAAGWPQHQFQIRLNCARATFFYACAFPLNVVTNILRISMVIFDTEEGIYTQESVLRTVPTFVSAHTFCASRKP